MKICVISDTHSYLEDGIIEFCSDADEIWHAGDIGSVELFENLENWKSLRAVYGNIDDYKIRLRCKEILFFEIEGKKILITHIGGYPGKYAPGIRNLLTEMNPDIFICGHSHILKIMYDDKHNLLYINPGAAGNKGWHKFVTAVKFEIILGEIKNMQVFEIKR